MTTYVAFLRAVNVGGHNKVKMADLKQAFEKLGMVRVQTYIQSGNVLFQADEGEETLRGRIEHGLRHGFGISTTAILRTAAALERMVANCPFSEDEVTEAQAGFDGVCLHVGMFTTGPPWEEIQRIETFQSAREKFVVDGRDVFLLLLDGLRHSKLAPQLDKLGQPPTLRNWKTINKLCELARAMEA